MSFDPRDRIRDMTLGELRELLAEYPDHMPVAPFINGTVGVMLTVSPHTDKSGPVLLIGEPTDLKAPPTVPSDWQDRPKPSTEGDA